MPDSCGKIRCLSLEGSVGGSPVRLRNSSVTESRGAHQEPATWTDQVTGVVRAQSRTCQTKQIRLQL